MATKKTILVVDDSEPVRQQVSLVLEQAGFEVVEADDGQMGAEMLDERRFDMVFCDINMPRLDGIGMVEKVRKNPDSKKVPIIMLTTEGAPSLIKRARELGANGWIVKPFKPEQLVAVARKLTMSS